MGLKAQRKLHDDHLRSRNSGTVLLQQGIWIQNIMHSQFPIDSSGSCYQFFLSPLSSLIFSTSILTLYIFSHLYLFNCLKEMIHTFRKDTNPKMPRRSHNKAPPISFNRSSLISIFLEKVVLVSVWFNFSSRGKEKPKIR